MTTNHEVLINGRVHTMFANARRSDLLTAAAYMAEPNTHELAVTESHGFRLYSVAKLRTGATPLEAVVR